MPHGGKRRGSGRKATSLARTAKKLKRVEAEEILASIDEQEYWGALLNASVVTSVTLVGGEEGEREQITVPDYRIRLDALRYLTDRRDGKPAQAINHSGQNPGEPFRVVVEHIGPHNQVAAKANKAAPSTQ